MRVIFASLLLALLAGLCQGCVMVPIPASGKTATCGTRIGKEETHFIITGQTTHAEVIARFGQPFAVCEERAGIAHSWSVNSWNYFVIWPAPELFDYGSLADRDEALMFQFDRDDRVERFEFKRLSGNQSVKDTLCQWAETKPPN